MKYTPRQYAEALYEALLGKTESQRKTVLSKFDLVLRRNNDSKLKDLILVKYEKVFLSKKNLRKVDIESAKPLKPDTKKNIEIALNSALLITEKTNPDLIAGLTILLDDNLYIDASAKNKIHKLFTNNHVEHYR